MSVFDTFVFAINSVLPVIILVAIGYYLKRIGLFTKDFLKIGNKTVFKILIPALLFTNLSSMSSFSELNGSAIIYMLIALFIIILFGFILTITVKDVKQKGVIWQCTFRSNFALIGVPLAELMAGQEGVRCAALISAFSIPIFNIAAVIALSVFVESENVTSPKDRIINILKGIITNPLIIAVFLGILVIFVKPIFYSMPASATSLITRFTFIQTVLSYLAKASTPVALLVLGGQFEFGVIKNLKSQIVTGCLARLIFAPLVGIGGAVILQSLGFIHFNSSVFSVFISLFGTPVAVSSAIMAEAMDNDGQLAAQLVVWTTLLSSLTLFLLTLSLRAIGLL